MSLNNVTAVILAGGKGRRMGGIDKGLMQFNGIPMIEHVVKEIKTQCKKIIINANRHLDQYTSYQYPVISDDMSDFQGPLAGFSVALKLAETPFIITVPCDAPLLPPDYLPRMMDALLAQKADIAVVNDGERMQPVYALIKTTLADSLFQYLGKGERKIDLWYAQHNVIEVDFSNFKSCFNNINTPEQKIQMQSELIK